MSGVKKENAAQIVLDDGIIRFWLLLTLGHNGSETKAWNGRKKSEYSSCMMSIVYRTCENRPPAVYFLFRFSACDLFKIQEGDLFKRVVCSRGWFIWQVNLKLTFSKLKKFMNITEYKRKSRNLRLESDLFKRVTYSRVWSFRARTGYVVEQFEHHKKYYQSPTEAY